MKTVTVSSLVRTKEEAFYRYVIGWVRNPDKGSAFDRAVKRLRLHLLPDGVLFHILLMLRYDGILFLENDEVVGHIFFQRHGKELHAFSFYTRPDMRGGRMDGMMQALHRLCVSRELRLVKMADGGSEITTRYWCKVADRKTVAPFKARTDLGVGWLEPLPIAA